MARGRPKTPIERMQARSPDGKTPGKRNLPTPIETKADYSVPVPRIELSGRGEIEWENIWTAGWWLHREQDYHLVEMICQAYMDIEEYRAYVIEHGLITKGYAGQDAANPMIAEIRKCQQSIQKCLSMLGFSPTDRARLNLTEAKTRNQLQTMIEKSRNAGSN